MDYFIFISRGNSAAKTCPSSYGMMNTAMCKKGRDKLQARQLFEGEKGSILLHSSSVKQPSLPAAGGHLT